MDSKQESCDRTLKVRAVKRVIENGHDPHSVAAELGIKAEQLEAWVSRYATPADEIPNRLRLKTPIEELQELRREGEFLKRERDFIKQATENSFLAKQ